MARKNKTPSENDETEHETAVATAEAPEGADGGSDDQGEAAPPLRANNELLPNVVSAGSTITGCSESEVKNYLATMDFICRQLSVLMADKWPKICKAARAAGELNEKSAKVPVSVKIDIDHTNILLMDTKVHLSFVPEKIHATAETTEDLSQTEFALT